MSEIKIEGIEKLTAVGKNLSETKQRIQDLIFGALVDFGEKGTGTIRERYLSGASGSLKPRSGRLRSSIRYSVAQANDAASVTFGTDVPYAPIHEFGGRTRPMVIEARRKKVLRFLVGGTPVFARRVNHPGSNIPARPFLKPGVEDEVPWLMNRTEKLLMQAAEGAFNV